MQTDWLGNEIQVGDKALYSSTSTHTGMNLGELVSVLPTKIQIKIPVRKWNSDAREFQPGTQIVTLQKGTSAFRSVTKYFGPQLP
jgi:hypothetical protein